MELGDNKDFLKILNTLSKYSIGDGLTIVASLYLTIINAALEHGANKDKLRELNNEVMKRIEDKLK